MMIRTLAILCLVAAPAFGIWEKGMKVKYDINPLNAGKKSFLDMPSNKTVASNAGWVETEKPKVPAGYESLVMMCQDNFYDLCLFYDDTGYIAGSQICLNTAFYSGQVFEWEQSGFTKWSVAGGEYYCVRQFFASADYLASDPATRIANRDSDYILQDDSIYLEDIDGILRKVPTTYTDIASSSDFTKQACFVGMGNHHYYKMTTAMKCTYDAVSRWFLLTYNDQFIGTGFSFPGTYKVDSNSRDIFEYPNKMAIKMIVPTAPECYYAYGDSGMIVLHTYFIKDPNLISCIW